MDPYMSNVFQKLSTYRGIQVPTTREEVEEMLAQAPRSSPPSISATPSPNPWDVVNSADVIRFFDWMIGDMHLDGTNKPGHVESLAASVWLVFHGLSHSREVAPLDYDAAKLFKGPVVSALFGLKFKWDPDVPAPDSIYALNAPTKHRNILNVTCILDMYGKHFVNHRGIVRRIAGDLPFLKDVVKWAAARTRLLWEHLGIVYKAFSAVIELFLSIDIHDPVKIQVLFRDHAVEACELHEFRRSASFERSNDDEELLKGINQAANAIFETAFGTIDAASLRKETKKQLRIRPPPATAGRLYLPDACDYCGKNESSKIKLKKCSKCSVARYCSAECQSADWKSGVHKSRCRS